MYKSTDALYAEATRFVIRAAVHEERELVERLCDVVNKVYCPPEETQHRTRFLSYCRAALDELPVEQPAAEPELDDDEKKVLKGLLQATTGTDSREASTEWLANICGCDRTAVWQACLRLSGLRMLQMREDPCVAVYWSFVGRGLEVARSLQQPATEPDRPPADIILLELKKVNPGGLSRDELLYRTKLEQISLENSLAALLSSRHVIDTGNQPLYKLTTIGLVRADDLVAAV